MSDLFKNLDTAFSWIGMRGSILLVLSILASCSQTDDIPEQQQETPVEEVVTDTRLRLSSIGELENISTESIPGAENYSGWQLESLTYNCIDTIEQRALLMDVEATLISGTNREVTLRFLSEVGPELVSVEYYPKVEVVAAHHNMLHGVYPRVERYRNYSDGSRIGPDLFYDYGHPVAGATGSYCGSPSLDKSYWRESPEFYIGENVNPETQFVENGKHCQYLKTEIGYFNTNACAYNEKGEFLNGEDIFPDKFVLIENTADSHSEDYHIYKNDFYGPGIYGNGSQRYTLSRGYNMDDDTTKIAMNLCKDIPIAKNAPQFSEDTQNLTPGFYFTLFYNSYDDKAFELRSNLSRLDRPYLSEAVMESHISFYSQYLIIDGRLIHFNDVCNFRSAGFRHQLTKSQDMFQLRVETEWQLYGEKFMSRGDLILYKKNGPEEIVYDARDYGNLNDNDQSELDKAKSRARTTSKFPESEDYNNGLMPRPDGKTVKMDTTLPSSIQSMPRSRTIKTM